MKPVKNIIADITHEQFIDDDIKHKIATIIQTASFAWFQIRVEQEITKNLFPERETE